jgi:hypothetical protein
MPHAQDARLRDALQDYIAAHRGDGPGHSGRLTVGGEHVKTAKQLLEGLGGSQDVREDTPGRRAAGSVGEGAPNFDPGAHGLTE